MAQLPDPNELARVAPRAKGSVSSYQPNAATEADIALGNTIATLADREINRLDELKATDAETQLMRKELELQTEYANTKGGDVLKPDFHSTYQDRYKQNVEELSNSLSTPAQRAKFKQYADRRGVSFDASRISYAMGEADKYETQVFTSRLEAVTDNATANYAKPDVVAASVLELENTFAKEMIRKGVSDPAILSTELKALRGNFYSRLIDRALVDNDTVAANATFAAARGLLSDEQKKTFEARLRPANDFAEGQKLAAEAQSMLAAGKNMQEVEMFVAKNSTTPGAYNAAQTIFTNLQQANAKAQAESKGTVLMMFHSTGNPVQGKVKVLQSQEYQRLSPTQQVEALDYMDADIQQQKQQQRADIQFGWSAQSHRWAAESHADAVTARREAKIEKAKVAKYNTPEVMAEFSRMVTDPRLKDKSRQEIWAASEKIGPTLTAKLLAEQELLTKQAKPLTINKELLEASKPPSLKKDKRTAENDAYDGYVKSALMDWQVANPGKTLTPEQERALLQSANAVYTTAGRFFNSTRKVYEPLPEGREASEAAIKQGILKAAARRAITLTPAQVDAKYKEYLSKQK